MILKEGREELELSPNPNLYPRKMILRQGAKHILLDTLDIVYCYSSNKIVYIIDVNANKYISDKNLVHLESELDPRYFFKVNRTQIINFHFIHSFISHDRNKMRVDLKTSLKDQSVIISQTRVNAFRQWIYKQL